MTPLTKDYVIRWINNTLGDGVVSVNCMNCLVSKIFEMWSKTIVTQEDFNSVMKGKSCEDQAKMIHLIANYNCADVCNIPPIDKCLN